MSEGHAPARKHTPRTASQPAPPPLDPQKTALELRTFVEQAVRHMSLSLEWEISMQTADPGLPPGIVVEFRGEDEPLLLERNAELLLALEYIAHRCLRLDPRQHDGVRFDCGDYRSVRLDELKLSARVAAQRVRETGEPFRFNPMSSRERRLIHLELSGAAGVRTASEGTGDRRQLVIYPANKK